MGKSKRFCVALFVALMFLLTALASCSKSHASMATKAVNQDYTSNETVAGGTADADSGGTSDAAMATSTATVSAVSNAGRKVIQDAELTIETRTYEKSVAALQTLVAKEGGYLADSSIEGTGDSETGDGSSGGRTATFTAMIPAGKLSDFLSATGNLGTVTSQTSKGEDITQQYSDTQGKLKMLETEQERLLSFMGQSSSVSDMLTIEQRLTDVQTQIAQLQGQLNEWDKLVSLSTVKLTLNEVTVARAPAPKNFGQKIASGFMASLIALGVMLQKIAEIFVVCLPFLMFFGALTLLVLWIIRLSRRRRNKSGPMPPQE